MFYATHDQHYPSESEERAGYWVGFAEHCGDSLTHKVLDAETLKIIHRSALRHRTLKNPSKRLVDDGGRKIISLTKTPLNIQLQIHQTHLLSISSQGMMMVQHQGSPCQSSIQKILLEGLSCYPLETMGRD